MRKIYILISVVISLSLLTSCGNTNVAEKDAAENDPAAIEKEQTPDYIVNLDDSFNTGIDVGEKRELLSEDEADFRHLKWGMTKGEVAYVEGTGYREPDENTMYYKRVREEDYPCDAEYTFEDGKLVQGVFFITYNKDESALAEISDYDILVNSLKERFGEPDLSQKHFYNNSDKTDNVELHKDLIIENKLQYRTAWYLNGTELRVVAYGNGGKLCIGLQYKKI